MCLQSKAAAQRHVVGQTAAVLAWRCTDAHASPVTVAYSIQTRRKLLQLLLVSLCQSIGWPLPLSTTALWVLAVAALQQLLSGPALRQYSTISGYCLVTCCSGHSIDKSTRQSTCCSWSKARKLACKLQVPQ